MINDGTHQLLQSQLWHGNKIGWYLKYTMIQISSLLNVPTMKYARRMHWPMIPIAPFFELLTKDTWGQFVLENLLKLMWYAVRTCPRMRLRAEISVDPTMKVTLSPINILLCPECISSDTEINIWGRCSSEFSVDRRWLLMTAFPCFLSTTLNISASELSDASSPKRWCTSFSRPLSFW